MMKVCQRQKSHIWEFWFQHSLFIFHSGGSTIQPKILINNYLSPSINNSFGTITITITVITIITVSIFNNFVIFTFSPSITIRFQEPALPVVWKTQTVLTNKWFKDSQRARKKLFFIQTMQEATFKKFTYYIPYLCFLRERYVSAAQKCTFVLRDYQFLVTK